MDVQTKSIYAEWHCIAPLSDRSGRQMKWSTSQKILCLLEALTFTSNSCGKKLSQEPTNKATKERENSLVARHFLSMWTSQGPNYSYWPAASLMAFSRASSLIILFCKFETKCNSNGKYLSQDKSNRPTILMVLMRSACSSFK